MITIIIILYVISLLYLTIGKGIADVVSEEDLWRNSIFAKHFKIDSFWGCKDFTWKRKHKNNKILNWLFSNPLVFLTDVWHLANTFQRLGLYLAMIASILFGFYIPSTLLNLAILFASFIGCNVIGFHLIYNYLLINNCSFNKKK